MIGRTFVYCPLCGTKLVERHLQQEGKTRLVCASCDFIYYQNPTPAAGVVVVEADKLLMVKRKYEPRAGMWTFPAGFIESTENAAECAARETKEETNLDVEIMRLFNVYSAFDDPRTAVVLVMYLARRIGGELRCGDDASDARFFDLTDLPRDIAFRAHRLAIRDVMDSHRHGNM